MQIDFDTRSAEDYARFLAVRKCPIYQFKGSAAIVPDEYASLIGVKAKRKTGKKYTPAVKLFDYQADIVRIAVERRKYAIFADCGLGKTLMLLEFARHCAEQTRGKVLIVSPLMVCRQTVDEALRWYGESFPIGRVKAFDLQYWLNSSSSLDSQIGITNYEAIREGLEPGKLTGLILDESSMLKSHYGAWGTRLIEELWEPFNLKESDDFLKPSELTIEIHAGADYCHPLAEILTAVGIKVELPLKGLGIGEQLAWYGKQVTA